MAAVLFFARADTADEPSARSKAVPQRQSPQRPALRPGADDGQIRQRPHAPDLAAAESAIQQSPERREEPDPEAVRAAVSGAAPNTVNSPEASPPHAGSIYRPALSAAFDGSGTTADDTSPLREENVEYDKDLGAAHLPPGASITYGDRGGVDPEKGTIGLWIRREWPTDEEHARALIDLRTHTWENRLQVDLGTSKLSFVLTGNDGIENAVHAPAIWAPDEWHHVTITWGEAQMSMYVDGTLADQNTYSAPIEIAASAPLHLGTTHDGPNRDGGPLSLRGLTILRSVADARHVGYVMQDSPP